MGNVLNFLWGEAEADSSDSDSSSPTSSFRLPPEELECEPSSSGRTDSSDDTDEDRSPSLLGESEATTGVGATIIHEKTR